ncbi:VWA domain-containing protein [Rhodobacteraceae bacterium R_SAG10]|nr:VWA domain-containing protein [Rhodobacteraceae bacterium R_SAG10]
MTKKTQLEPAGKSSEPAPTTSNRTEIDAFLRHARQLAPVADQARGRLIFALDATLSRQPTWDMACALQGEMFTAAAAVGDLSVQLVYFRGHREIRASRWVNNAAGLRDLMVRIDCRGGLTQIQRVLGHAKKQAERKPLAALVYVGDAMEENVDRLCAIAGELGLLNVKAFMFHDGPDPQAERAFREIARLTGGAYLPFSAASAADLKALLGAVATYAAGGRKALASVGSATARRLLSDIR